jgi:hypothetical protein
MPLCSYCRAAPAIHNSHVIPRFVSKHIKANSPFGHMLNSWKNKPTYDLHKGPYLCATCDNQVFSAWENRFSQDFWPDPLGSGACLGDEAIIRFVTSLAYRYALHFIATSPITRNNQYSEYFRDLTFDALTDPSRVGKTLYIYPYVFRPIASSCELLVGVNHLLNLAVHGESLPKEGNLPNAMIVMVPRLLLLFCDGDLSDSSDCGLRNPVTLAVGKPFDSMTGNADMPQFLVTPLNRWIGQGQAHQKSLGRWKRLAYGVDRNVNPHKMCYVAQGYDRALARWQQEHCEHGARR